MSNPISHLTATGNTSSAFNQSPAADNTTGTTGSDAYPGAYSSGLADAQPPVSHHVHREDEPLPGAQGSAPTVDYSSDAIRDAVLPPSEVGDTQDFHPTGGAQHHSTFQPQQDYGADRQFTDEQPVQPFERTTVGGSSSPGIQTTPLPPVPGYAGTTENREYNISSLQNTEYDVDGTPLGDKNYNQSTGKGGMGEKVIGKTEQVAGKVTGNTGLKEKGEANTANASNTADTFNTHNTSTTHDTSNTSNVPHTDYDIDGKPDGEKNYNRPTGKVSIGDKVIGKTEKIAGKITGNTDLQEKGVARAQGLN